MEPPAGATVPVVARARRAALLAALAAAGCGGDAPAVAPDTSTARAAERCGLLVLDQDCGAAEPGGGRCGALLLAAPGESPRSWLEPRLAATDPRWLDPADALPLPDGSWLVLESRWAAGDADAHGAIFRVTVDWSGSAGGEFAPRLRVEDAPWWTHPQTRQPVALALDDHGTLFVSDREADPAGLNAVRAGKTGCVFGVEIGPDGRPARTAIVAQGPELVTPGALLACGSRLLLMDADANPRGLRAGDGRPATPGVLYELVALDDGDPLAPRRLHALLESEATTSPVALIERRVPVERDDIPFDGPPPDWSRNPPELWLVDANYDTEPERLGDGALFRVEFTRTELVEALGGPPATGLAARLVLAADTRALGAHALVDPAYGCALPDGRLALADANADPLHLGADGGDKGVFARGRGAVFGWDPARPDALAVLAAGELFVTPVAVRVLRQPPAEGR